MFDRVHVNEGGAYHVHTGLFTAPSSGIYFLTMYAESGQADTRLDMRRDTRTLVSATFGPDTWMTGGNSVVVKMNRFETIRVMLIKGTINSYPNFPLISFSGFLLFQN